MPTSEYKTRTVCALIILFICLDAYLIFDRTADLIEAQLDDLHTRVMALELKRF